MDGRVEPPLAAVEPEALDHLQLEFLLPLDRERPAARRPLAVAADRRDERHLGLLQPREHSRTSAVFMPGSKSSSSTSYGSS